MHPASPPVPSAEDDAGTIASLRSEIERFGKNLYRLALAQESMFRELQKSLRPPSRNAGEADGINREKLALDFLPLVDALHRLEQALENKENKTLAEGAAIVAAKGEAYLAAMGVQAITSLGERFDPHIHHAVGVRQARPELQGFVVEEIVRGYRLGENILRTAQVVVGKEG